MSEKIDITDLNSIITYVASDNLKEAFESAKRCAVSEADWKTLDSLSSYERLYRSMTQYLQATINDPARHAHIAELKEFLLRTADKYLRAITMSNPNHKRNCELYFQQAATYYYMKDASGLVPTLHRLEKLSAKIDLASPSINGANEAMHRELFSTADDLFHRIWITQHLNSDESERISEFIRSKTVPDVFKALVISALTLALLFYYDKSKLLILLSHDYDEAELVTARKLTGIYLTIWRHPRRLTLDPDIKIRMSALCDDSEILEALRHTAKAVIRSRDTDRITARMKNEILPQLQKLQTELQRRFPSQQDLGDLLDPEKNPDWEEMLKEGGLQDSMQELSDMQLQGDDIMMMAFSNTKSLPFFNSLSNWLIPFTLSHPELDKITGDNRLIASTLADNADFICDSDKYSMSIMMSMVNRHGTSPEMIRKMREQFDQLREEQATSFKSDTRPKLHTQITLYVRMLFRLTRLFPKSRQKFPDPFADFIIPSDLPFLDTLFSDNDEKNALATFFFNKGYYPEALSLMLQLENYEDICTPQFMQKIGYAYQSTDNIPDALKYYHKAEFLSPDDKWLLRKLASLHRALGEHDKAVVYYRKLYSFSPDDSRITLNLANTLFDIGRYEEALKYYYKVDYLKGGSPRTWRPIAWCEFLLGNYERSHAFYDKIIHSKDVEYTDFINAGHLNLAENEINKALISYDKALSLYKGDTNEFLSVLMEDKNIFERLDLDKDMCLLLTDYLRYNHK